MATRASNAAAIDAGFARMADDPEYQADAVRIAEEHAVADWEALQVSETPAFFGLSSRDC